MKAAHLKPIKKKDIVGSNDSTSSRSSFVWNSIASGKKKTPGDRLEKHDMENDVYPVCYFRFLPLHLKGKLLIIFIISNCYLIFFLRGQLHIKLIYREPYPQLLSSCKCGEALTTVKGDTQFFSI